MAISLEKWWPYGWSEAIATSDNGKIMYVGSGAMLRIFYLFDSNPDVPQLAKEINLQGFINRIVFTPDRYIYVVLTSGENLMSDATLIILDARTSYFNPTVVTRYEGVPQISEILINGNIAYLAREHLGLTTLDITNKASPRIISTFKGDQFDRFNKMVLYGNYLYSIDDSNYTIIIADITNPANIVKAGFIPDMVAAFDVATYSKYLMVCIYYTDYGGTPSWMKGKGIIIFDLADPKNPVRRHAVDGYMPAVNYGWSAMKVSGTKLYVAETSNGVASYDLAVLTDSTPPTRLNLYSLKRYAREVAFAVNRFFVLNGYGWVSWNMDTGAYTEKREYARIYVVASTGNQYVFGLGDEWLWVFDITKDPFVPVTKVTLGGRTRENPAIWTRQGRTFISSGTGWGGFMVYEITNPASPKQLYTDASMNLMNLAYDPVNNILIVASLLSRGDKGIDHYIRTFDVSNPDSIKWISDLWVGRSSSYIDGNYNIEFVKPNAAGYIYVAYTVTNVRYLFIYKINADKTVSAVKSVNLNIGAILIMEIEGNYGYIGTDSGVFIIDLTDHINPRVLSRITTTTYAKNINTFGDIIYVTSSIGLSVINVTDKSNPKIIENVTLFGIVPQSVTRALNGSVVKLVLGTGECGVMVVDTGTLPTKRYKCSGAPNYICSEDANGIYGSLESCRSACKAAPGVTKYKIKVAAQDSGSIVSVSINIRNNDKQSDVGTYTTPFLVELETGNYEFSFTYKTVKYLKTYYIDRDQTIGYDLTPKPPSAEISGEGPFLAGIIAALAYLLSDNKRKR